MIKLEDWRRRVLHPDSTILFLSQSFTSCAVAERCIKEKAIDPKKYVGKPMSYLCSKQAVDLGLQFYIAISSADYNLAWKILLDIEDLPTNKFYSKEVLENAI